MKFFEKPHKKETLPLNQAEQKEILSLYEKTGLKPIYFEAFKKLHVAMEELRNKLITEGKPIEQVTKIVEAAEEKARAQIVEQGNKDYLETVKELGITPQL